VLFDKDEYCDFVTCKSCSRHCNKATISSKHLWAKLGPVNGELRDAHITKAVLRHKEREAVKS
jgi:hypothetical protein